MVCSTSKRCPIGLYFYGGGGGGECHVCPTGHSCSLVRRPALCTLLYCFALWCTVVCCSVSLFSCEKLVRRL